MNENAQKDILALGVPMANDCERTKTVIKRLKRKFPAEDDDDIKDTHIPKLSSWVLHEEEGTLEVTYKNGVQYSRPMKEMLKTGLLSIIEQLWDLTPSNDPKSKDAVILKNRLQQRRDELMALQAKMKFDDEESEESDEQSDGYISDVIPPTEDYQFILIFVLLQFYKILIYGNELLTKRYKTPKNDMEKAITLKN